MRLPEAKIKEALTHPHKLVRQEAQHYFADSFSRDPDVMALALKAIETHGIDHAFRNLDRLANLVQNEATIAWTIRTAAQPGIKKHRVRELSHILRRADPRLIQPHLGAIQQIPGIKEDDLAEIEHRQQLMSWHTARCWQELDSWCQTAAANLGQGTIDFNYGNRIVEELARRDDLDVEQVYTLLNVEIKDDAMDPEAFREPYLVMLAGLIRLERAIPIIVRRLHQELDDLAESYVEALVRIGTDAALAAVTADWDKTDWSYHLSATIALARIHTDTSVSRCLELLPVETDVGIKTWLADAALDHFATEAIEPVRNLVLSRNYDPTTSDLMLRLVAVSMLLDVRFPEYEGWRRDAEARWQQSERKAEELRRAMDATADRKPSSPPSQVKANPLPPRAQPVPVQRTEQRVGRNDPCPCGSGKKYKHCCHAKARS